MDVTDILRDRMQPQPGLQRMVTVSVLVHLALGAIVAVSPATWLPRRVEESRHVMTISIGGAGEGPVNGGMTAAGGRPVQAERPPEETPKREPVLPPAAKTPEMVLPTNKPRVSKTPPPVVRQAPDDARGRTPTRGAQTAPGTAMAETRGQGFGGLSTGGGPGAGSTLDVADFCCPEYLATMITRIRSAWMQNQGVAGESIVRFTILRTGDIVQPPVVEKSSGSIVLDLAAVRAVAVVKTLPPLPSQFPNPTLTVHLNFQYK
jgi:TonB family protein